MKNQPFHRGRKYLLYDGDCGVCKRSVEIIRRWDRNQEFVFAPYQEYSLAQLRSVGLTARRCRRELQAVTAEGSTRGGAFACNYYAGQFWPYSVFVKMIYAFPVLALAEVLIYRLIANNRATISKRLGVASCKLNFDLPPNKNKEDQP